MKEIFDLVIVGSGPGGYVAAVRAAQLGFKTALVERSELGGVCLNWGCIPTKALLHGAEIIHSLDQARAFGIETTGSIDLEKLVSHSRNVAGKLSRGIAYLMEKHAIPIIRGDARLSDKCELTITTDGQERVINARHIILATGAHARELPGIAIDGEQIWGAREAMTPKAIPPRLLIIGAGAIGVEFASLYADLGSDVVLIEALDRILPVEDESVSAFVGKAFSSRGIRVQTRTTVVSATTDENGVTVEIRKPDNTLETLTVDKIIQAVGISGNIDGLGLQELGVETDRGFIVTDAYCRTNLVGLYAIGDVAGPPWLAHKASHEAVLCVEKIAGVEGVHPLDTNAIPGCTYCRPQVASIGLTETQARATGRPIRIGQFNMAANGKALAIGDSSGFVKTVFDSTTGELLGAHMVGPEVTEQIQGYAIALSMEATEADLMRTVFPHPTLSEAMHESVLDAYDMAINQ